MHSRILTKKRYNWHLCKAYPQLSEIQQQVYVKHVRNSFHKRLVEVLISTWLHYTVECPTAITSVSLLKQLCLIDQNQVRKLQTQNSRIFPGNSFFSLYVNFLAKKGIILIKKLCLITVSSDQLHQPDQELIQQELSSLPMILMPCKKDCHFETAWRSQGHIMLI